MLLRLRQLLGKGQPGAREEATEEPLETIKPHQKRVFGTRDFYLGVAGTSHYQRAITAAISGKKSYKGTTYIPVVLQTEPDNPHDSNAVKVMTTNQETIGYLYREEAEAYAPVMQAWQNLAKNKGKWIGCEARVVENDGSRRAYLDLDKPESILA